MLVIRMQRTGRKGHAMFRVVIQDSRRTPTSGKVVAALGSYDPHAKSISLNKEKAQFYLDHGAQPSGRVAQLLKQEGIKLPSWVESADKKTGKIRNLEKLRRNRPAEEPTPEETSATPAEEAPAESAEPAAETPETPVEETVATAEPETPAAEPAEESAAKPSDVA